MKKIMTLATLTLLPTAVLALADAAAVCFQELAVVPVGGNGPAPRRTTA